MHKKASHRTGGKSLYGWSTGKYTKANVPNKELQGLSYNEIKQMRKKFGRPPSEEELQKMIEDFERKNPK